MKNKKLQRALAIIALAIVATFHPDLSTFAGALLKLVDQTQMPFGHLRVGAAILAAPGDTDLLKHARLTTVSQGCET